MAKKAPQDSTLRNVRAANRRIRGLERRADLQDTRTVALERQVAALVDLVGKKVVRARMAVAS